MEARNAVPNLSPFSPVPHIGLLSPADPNGAAPPPIEWHLWLPDKCLEPALLTVRLARALCVCAPIVNRITCMK